MTKLNFTVPTPIQNQAIPVAIAGNDVIGIAQTGTGKTLAFGIPTIQKLLTSRGSALIILPTRELALQVDESLSKIARNFNLRSAVLIGGQNMNKQLRDLKAGPRIIISTPGRLIDHLERKTVRLDRVETLVLDEADRMLDMGFAPQIKRILQEVPAERQTMLFSATMPTEIVEIANRYMKTPLRVEVAPAGSATDNVTHEIFFVRDNSKLALLESVLKSRQGSTLVFSRTKHGAKRIAFSLRKMGFTSTEIHSNRTLAQRIAALEGFKQGKFRVMVATDIAARGIDVKGIELVVNYDLPDSPEDYVHRIGRTGRAENLGHAISFATPKQAYDIRIIERLIKKPLPVSQLPELAPLDASVLAGPVERDEDRGRGGRGGRDSSRGESRGRSASGSRYGRSSRSGDSNRSEKSEETSNPRRGFLPKRTGERSLASRSTVSPAQKGRDFYKDFSAGSFLEERSSQPERSNEQRAPRSEGSFSARRNESSQSRPSGRSDRKPQGFAPQRDFRSSTATGRTQPVVSHNTVPEAAEESFPMEPFMNAAKSPDYRKPFGPFKPRESRGGQRPSNNRGPRRTASRSSR